MNILSILAKKRDGFPLNKEEIRFIAQGAAKGTLPDYQLSALLMAIRINGMNAEETTQLTMEMAFSGEQVNLQSIKGVKVDKHSTGGVADTTTLVALPLAAAVGVKFFKMSGRGLGHTGGTLDKLSAIPNFSTQLSQSQALAQVNRIGAVLLGQSANLAPADKTLYALRDVTETVDSIPLIASSILSKKFASGCDGIVLDVKSGSGALMQEPAQAQLLADTMCEIGKKAGKKIVAFVTDMSQPLGRYVGNALEVKEALLILQGKTEGRLKELSVNLTAQMAEIAQIENAKETVLHALESKKGLEKMAEWIAAQGGDPNLAMDVSLLPQSEAQTTLFSEQEGFFQYVDCVKVGLAARSLGAGRTSLEDEIDLNAGLYLYKETGDRVKKGEPLAILYHKKNTSVKEAAALFAQSYQIIPTKPSIPVLIQSIRK